MNLFDPPAAVALKRDGSKRRSVIAALGRARWRAMVGNRELIHVVETAVTTLLVFIIFLVQGIIVARFLGPLARGEFGTALFFPRDILLYAGLLGGVEIINTYASRNPDRSVALKYSAARFGLLSGTITALAGAVLSTMFLMMVGKQYLIPFCLITCMFVPWEHMHLTISSVDRGTASYTRYNVNRLVFAAAFPLMAVLTFAFQFDRLLGLTPLMMMCLLFVVSKVLGLLPTLRGMRFPGGFLGFQSTRPHNGDVPSARHLLRDGRPYALATLANELFERLDIWLIVALASVTESGFYFVGVPAAALLTVVPNALGVFTFNAGANSARRVSMRQTISILGGMAGFHIASMIGLALCLPWLIILLYGEPFRPAIPFALWLLPAAAIRGYLQAADGYLKGRGKPLIGVWTRALSIVAMLGFVYFAFSTYDLISIPMAAGVGQFISMLIITTCVLTDVRTRDYPLQEAG
jgi:O-antigen/teichoic acid export membrane protein